MTNVEHSLADRTDLEEHSQEVDYPAAHSVDTTWFAVDEDGHVAIFESGENGPIPVFFDTGDGLQGLTPDMLQEKIETVRGVKRDKFDRPLSAELGFFAYEAETEKSWEVYEQYDPDDSKEVYPSLLYARTDIPAQPITLADLPSEWHETIELVRVPVSFTKAELFQPGEHFPSVGWGTDYYLGVDLQEHAFTKPAPEIIELARSKKHGTVSNTTSNKPWWQRLLGM